MVTNYIKNATYKEIYDIHTDTESTSILTFHTPVNKFPRKMLEGFFNQYRRFKYCGATVRLQPVARLPADPEQISYQAGEPGIDPRDMVNPVLVRGYCGDSLGTFLNRYLAPGAQSLVRQNGTGGSYEVLKGSGFLGSSVDKTSFPDGSPDFVDLRSAYLQKLYYQSLGDPHFRKVGVQRGMKKFFYPLVYDLATTTQYLAHNPDYDPLNPDVSSGKAYGGLVNGLDVYGTGQRATDIINREGRHNDFSGSGIQSAPQGDPTATNIKFTQYSKNDYRLQTSPGNSNTANRGFALRVSAPILTSNKRRLGWLDTDSVVVDSTMTSGSQVTNRTAAYPTLGPDINSPFISEDMHVVDTTLPLINMGIAILPKAYKTEMCWRLSITHHFDFKDFRPMTGLVSPFDNDAMGLTPILEWSDWDNYGQQIYANSSVTSTAKNVELVDVEGSVPEDFEDTEN